MADLQLSYEISTRELAASRLPTEWLIPSILMSHGFKLVNRGGVFNPQYEPEEGTTLTCVYDPLNMVWIYRQRLTAASSASD
jgi:hypothetical protein